MYVKVRNAVMHSVNSHAQPAAELPTQMNGHPQIISFDTMPVVHVGGSQLSTYVCVFCMCVTLT